MEPMARIHALEILVDVLIASLPGEHRRLLARQFAERAEIARSEMRQQPVPKPMQAAIDGELSRLSRNLDRIARSE